MCYHQCPQQPDFAYVVQYDTDWYLEISRYVQEDELEQLPYVENIGDTLWTTRCLVIFCPFCAQRLADSIPLDKWHKQKQQPEHFDFQYK